MAEKPILFNTAMTQAILDGRKTTTRRIIKPQMPENVIKTCEVDPLGYMSYQTSDTYLGGWRNTKAPYAVGDTLWVRETWQNIPDDDGNNFIYLADEDNTPFCKDDDGNPIYLKWRPSIHMPREAARLFLRVTDVRVERIQDISYEDCMKEGIKQISGSGLYDCGLDKYYSNSKQAFEKLWENLYHNWSNNPWVWVIHFERIR